MKTFAQLKRDLKEGVKIRCLYNYYRENFPKEYRTITKVQTNAITLETITEDGIKQLWLYFPKSSTLVEYENNIFKFFVEPNKYNNFTKTLEFIYEILEN